MSLPPSSLPPSMNAVEITSPGKPEVLKPCTRPLPQPRAGEVLIDEATRAKLGARARCHPKGEVQLKGFDAPLQVFRLEAVDPVPPPV